MKVWKDEFCRRAVADGFPIFEPYYGLSEEHKGWLWHGLPSERDVSPHERVSIDEFFRMLTENQYKIQYRVMLSRYRGKTKCPECHGTRLKKEAGYVRIGADETGHGGKTITQLVNMSIEELHEWFCHLRLTPHEQKVARRLLTEITSRIEFLLNIGLGYLTLNRPSNTLSGGESQRINLCTSLGSSLIGSLYILDEPSIGLHPRDTSKLISVVRKLQEIGNCVARRVLLKSICRNIRYRPLIDNLTTMTSGVRTDVDKVVSRAHNLLIMLDDDDSVANLLQLAHN